MDNEYNENGYENEETNVPVKKSRIWSVTALVLAIISVILCFVPVLSIILGAFAIGLSVLSRVKIGYFDGIAIASIIVAIFGIVFAFAHIITSLILA